MTRRMVIFVDYENTRRGGGRAFLQSATSSAASSLCLTELAEAIRTHSRDKSLADDIEVDEVRAYQGYYRNNKGRRRFRNRCTCDQCSGSGSTHKWEGRPYVKLWAAEKGKDDDPNSLKEKGVDSSLVLDFVEAMYEESCDIVVIVSSDRDILSALAHDPVKDLIDDKASPVIQIAAWKPDRDSIRTEKYDPDGAWNTASNFARDFGIKILPLSRSDYRKIAVG